MKLLTVRDYAKRAKKLLPKMVYDYYRSGADDQITLRRNKSDFSKIQLLPRVLKDVSQIDTSIEILGQKIDMPILIAPSAMQKMAHPDGEIATARAASKLNVITGLSTSSTTSLEDFSKEVSHGGIWFQLYVTQNRAITMQLIEKAEKANYKALVVTVDAPVLGNRESDHRNRFHVRFNDIYE